MHPDAKFDATEIVMQAKLTDRSVTAIKPGDRIVEVWDQVLKGFGIRVMPTGKRTYVASIRRPRAKGTVRIKVGVPGDPPLGMSLADARAKAREIMAREQGMVPDKVTVSEAIERYIRDWQKPRNRSWREVERTLCRELASWGSRPVRGITQLDVVALLDRTAKRAPAVANRLRAYLSKFFGWLAERKLVDASPVVGVSPPRAEVSRDRTLTEDELIAVWRAAGELGWPFGSIVRLLILTGARRDEIGSLRWTHVDLTAREIRLPREMVKNDQPHVIPLSRSAVRIIASLPRIDGSEFVFPSTRNRERPASGYSKVKLRLDKATGIAPWRLHDIRRTVATGLQRLGVRLEVTEAVLGHVSGSRAGIVGIYQRHQYTDEKRAVLRRWAAQVYLMERARRESVVETT